MYSGANDVQDHAPPASLLVGGNGCDVLFIPAQAHARNGERSVQITSPSEGCTVAVNLVGFSPCQQGTVSDPQDNAMGVPSTAAHIPERMSGAPSCVGQDARLNCHVPPYSTIHAGVDGWSSLALPGPLPPHVICSPITGNHEMAQMNVPQRDEVTCGATFRDHQGSSGHSLDQVFDPRLPPSCPANVSLPSSHGSDARMSSASVSNAQPLPSLNHITSQPGCVANHEKMCSDYDSSGRKVNSAIPLSLPSNMVCLQAQESNLSALDHYRNAHPRHTLFLVALPVKSVAGRVVTEQNVVSP
ncbi:hypothetical protein EDC04DRAFT_948194 [Pisolithus marmoratus]|nr:hypothetical protein EDC04DRAFT_948194 [Pisolithus marmoratus]